jgi:hypothetical protein
MNQCQYCKKQYTSISNLNYHQKTTKACLKIQEALLTSSSSIVIKCQYCNKDFSCKSSLKHHEKTSKTCKQPPNSGGLLDQTIICLGCNKNFNSKINLELHSVLCLELKDRQIRENEEKYQREKKENEEKYQRFEDRIRSLERENKEIVLQNVKSECKLKVLQEQLTIQQKLNENLQNRLFQKATSKSITNNTTTNVELNLFMSKESVDDKINRLFTMKYIYMMVI